MKQESQCSKLINVSFLSCRITLPTWLTRWEKEGKVAKKAALVEPVTETTASAEQLKSVSRLMVILMKTQLMAMIEEVMTVGKAIAVARFGPIR